MPTRLSLGPSRVFSARANRKGFGLTAHSRLTILPGMLRLFRLDFPEGAFIMQATHSKGRMQATHCQRRMQANHSKGRFLAACGLDRFMAEVIAEPPVASEWKRKWWPRGRAAPGEKQPRKANCSWHLRRMRGGVEKRKAASKLYCRERSRISAVGFGLLWPGNRWRDRDQRAPTSGRQADKRRPTFQLLTRSADSATRLNIFWGSCRFAGGPFDYSVKDANSFQSGEMR